MNPTVTQIHVNQPLSNFSYMAMQDASGFVADQVFKAVPCPHKTDIYYKYNTGDFNRITVKERSAGAESSGGGFNISTATPYLAKVYSLHKDIADQERGNADAQINLDFAAAQYLTQQIMIHKENLWMNAFFKTGVWTNETTPGTLWSSANSTPIEDIRTMKRNVQLSAGGYRVNTLVLGRTTYDVLLDHSEIVARVQYSVKAAQGDAAKVAKDTLAQLFEVDRVLVSDGIQNTAAENVTATNAFLAGKHALLCYVPDGPVALNTVAAGLQFGWTGQFGSSPMGTRMLSIPDPLRASTRVEIEAAYAFGLVSADLGGFFLSAVA